MSILKNLIKKTPMYPVLRKCKTSWIHAREIAEWNKQGKPVPPPHCIKQGVLKDYARRYNTKILVETGTCYGAMVEAMRGSFDQVYSIELGDELYKKAAEKFRGVKNVKLFHGDSAVEIEKIVNLLTGPALFWLDGHYSGGASVLGSEVTPIFNELKHIFKSSEQNHVIIIDDARCFTGEKFAETNSGYPTLSELETFIKKQRPWMKIEIADDMIRVTPS